MATPQDISPVNAKFFLWFFLIISIVETMGVQYILDYTNLDYPNVDYPNAKSFH